MESKKKKMQVPLINDYDPITLESLQNYDPRSIVAINVGDRAVGFYVMSIYRWIGRAGPILNPLTGTEMDSRTISTVNSVKKSWVHALYQEELDQRFPNDDRVQIFVRDPVNGSTWTFWTRLDEDTVRFIRMLSDAFGYTSSHHLRVIHAGRVCDSKTLAEMGIQKESTITAMWACTTAHLYTHVPSLLPLEEN